MMDKMTHTSAKDGFCRKLYAERREWGVCIICGRPRRNSETTLACADCTAKRAEYRRQRRDHLRESAKERMDRYRSQGCCPYCGKPAVPGRVVCQYHLEYYAELRRKQRKKERE